MGIGDITNPFHHGKHNRVSGILKLNSGLVYAF